MKKRLLGTKLLSAVLAAAVTMSGVPVTALAGEAAPKSEDGLIASFDFDDEETGFSGAGAKAVVNGTAVFEDSYDGAGKALAVSDSDWLSVYAEDDSALLKGLDEVTISYDSKIGDSGNNKGWTFFAARNMETQEYLAEHYLGVIDTASEFKVERFNGGNRPESPMATPTSAWKHVDVVVTETQTILYIDGEETGRKDSAFKLSDILGSEGGIIQIGKANWVNGEYFEGLIDNVKIYSRAKEAAEIAEDAPVIVQDEDAENTTPFASYAFNGNTEDSSGNGYNGTLTGTASYETDGRGGIVFPTGEDGQTGVNYVRLDDSILDKLQDAGELTVTAWVRNDITSGNSNARGAVFSFGSDEKNQFSFATLNWGKARATFLVNNKEMGGDWNNNDNTSLLGNTPGNVDSPLGQWYQIAVTLRDVSAGDSSATRLKYYLNGELLCNLVTPAAISDLGDLTYAYIGTGNAKDFYRDFQGGIRQVDFIGEVLSPSQVASKYETEEAFFAKTDAEIVAEVEENLTIPNADDIRGNITLPSEVDGAAITWESSNEAVVSTEEKANDGYDSTPAGVVTRGGQDVSVKLTATISKGVVEPVQKEFNLTVKADSGITEEDYEAYLFAYFTGEGSSMGEQIYFATSEDGLNWTAMNEGDPIATSSMGEKGLRDPFIIRSHEGDRFYMIATDLKINQGNGWGAAQTSGSQSIMVWESTDLVNWSDQRMVKVARDDAGCTWAPEAFYDEKTGEYIVFWASKTSEDNYGVQKVYYAKTRDFYTFTEPEVWIELYKSTNNTPLSIIDTSVISVMEDGEKVYYRFSKNEAGEDHDTDGGQGKYTIMEKSDSLLGEWTQVTALKDHRWVEGGTCFKFNGEDKWCLLLDDFGGKGYYPLITTDLGSAQFTELGAGQYSFPSTMRHGTVLSLTQEEYDAVMAKWNRDVQENTEQEQEEAVLSYDFEEQAGDGVIKDTSGSGRDGRMFGNATYVEDEERGGQVLYLDGATGSYASLPEGFFEGRNSFTVSMDVKAESVSGNFFTFGIGKSDGRYIFLRTEDTKSRLSMTTGSYGSEQTASGTTDSIKGRWVNYTMVVTPEKISLYADGLLLASQNVTVKMTDLGINLLSYLGRSFYAADGYFKGYYDNVEVFNRAMDAVEVADRNGVEFTVTYEAKAGGKIQGTAVQTIPFGGSTQEVTAVADEGYVFTGWSDGNKEATRSDSNVTGNVTYTAEFKKRITVDYVAGEGGRIEGTASQTILQGESTEEVTAVAEEGYVFTGWSDGKTEATRSDSNVTENVTYTAEFKKAVTVEYKAEEGGRIEGSAVQTVAQGGSTKAVTAVAEEGYIFTRWSDGKTEATRSDSNVTENATYTAEFEKAVTVEYKAEEGGRIEGTAIQNIVQGGNTTEVTAVAEEGYVFIGWSDGKTEATRSESNVTADATYTAEFKKLVTVEYIAGEGGRIEGTAIQTVSQGENTEEVTAVAEEGYVFIGWSDGKTEATRSESNVTESVTYTAKFEKKSEPSVENVTVEYVAGEGGTIQGTATQVIEKGGNTAQVTAVASEGYTFSKWSDGVATASRSDNNVTASMKVTAIFTKNAADDSQKPDDKQPEVSKVKLNEKKLTMGVKEKVTLKATVLPVGASQKVTWISSNKKVVTVNQKGRITAKKKGSAVITAKTENGKKVTCKVTVKKAPKKLTLKAKTKTLKVGKSFKIKTQIGKQFGCYKFTYKSNKPKVVSVSADGKVKAKKKGTAVITVRTFNKKKATVRVTVK